MKNTLPTIMQNFSDVRVVQSELEAMLQEPSQGGTMMFLVAANVPLLYFLNKNRFLTLICTTPGKIALAVCAAIILFSLNEEAAKRPKKCSAIFLLPKCCHLFNIILLVLL